MHNAISNDEIRRLCDANESLRKELAESLDQPKILLEHVPKSVTLKGKQFEIFQAASNEKFMFIRKCFCKSLMTIYFR